MQLFPKPAVTWGHQYKLLNIEPNGWTGGVFGFDGVGWSPIGTGKGLAFYNGTMWKRLDTTETTIQVDGDAAAAGSFNLIGGTGVELVQDGGDITINATGGGSEASIIWAGTVIDQEVTAAAGAGTVFATSGAISMVLNESVYVRYDGVIRTFAAASVTFECVSTGIGGAVEASLLHGPQAGDAAPVLSPDYILPAATYSTVAGWLIVRASEVGNLTLNFVLRGTGTETPNVQALSWTAYKMPAP